MSDRAAGGQTQLGGEMTEGTGEYNTPLPWVAPLADAVGGFDLDPCASADSDLATENIRETGGLEADWADLTTPACYVGDVSDAWVWCNHPYARGEPERWLAKAHDSPVNVVTLSRSDTSTTAFGEFHTAADIVCWPNTASERGDPRVQFVGEDDPADFPVVFAVFLGDAREEVPQPLRDVFERWGVVTSL
ncbi:DNA N-6-adenine-methyltransferase [Halobaculum lipolyticum]|uniref:DNA N-6-adenine-methyltransferase n=1 Tax=Halobaculum lipolyticum TaxID=3032001 RepID=A0ABD5WDR0_9EURY|nr:DNA N-6-adenine-methyltransferase [Halobaculum sp. DT31]